MAYCIYLIVVVLLTSSALIYLLCEDKLLPTPPIPDTPIKWWAAGKRPNNEETGIKPFKVSVDADTLEDLNTRIQFDLKRLSEPLEDAAFEFGANVHFLKDFAKYWTENYDWKEEETHLNTFPQFKTSIDGLEIHFLHAKPTNSKSKKIVPLLLVHGWPGSVVEFLDIIPILTKGNEKIAFEVIAPSIPGYGFSSAPTKKGFNALYAAKIFHTLMNRLDHDKFYAQGGDWGSVITSTVATLYPDSVLGLHLNMAGFTTPGGTVKNFLSQIPGMKYFLADKEDYEKVDNLFADFSKILKESGYMHLQATKPDTLGVALSNSPLGLAAYILEKFSTWTNPSWVQEQHGGLGDKHPISKDRMITNIMVYWINNCITSSMRFYKEIFSMNQDFTRIPLTMPFAFADFPNELFRVPKFLLKSKFPNLVSFSRMPTGGHFAAMEVPSLLAEDIISFVHKVEDNKGSGEQEL